MDLDVDDKRLLQCCFLFSNNFIAFFTSSDFMNGSSCHHAIQTHQIHNLVDCNVRTACNKTLSMGVKSVARDFGRLNGIQHHIFLQFLQSQHLQLIQLHVQKF